MLDQAIGRAASETVRVLAKIIHSKAGAQWCRPRLNLEKSVETRRPVESMTDEYVLVTFSTSIEFRVVWVRRGEAHASAGATRLVMFSKGLHSLEVRRFRLKFVSCEHAWIWK